MKVAIRTDSSLRIGTGHVMRCLTLAKALVEKGAEVSFICREHEGSLIDQIQSESFKVYSLTTRPGDNSPLTLHHSPFSLHAKFCGSNTIREANALVNSFNRSFTSVKRIRTCSK